MNENKKILKLATIGFAFLMIFATLMTNLNVVSGHDPPWNIHTYTYVSVAPETVGVGQEVLIYMWLHITPPTSVGPYGDRWEDITGKITTPDGTVTTLGPFTSDPIGFAWTQYTPTQIGTYTLQSSFPGQTVAGNNLSPTSTSGHEYIGDYYEPSSSDIIQLTVQEDPIPAYPNSPVPTGYWERPIDAQHRDWWTISGNWLINDGTTVAHNTKGPETSHILWTRGLGTFGGGGLVGGDFESTSYHDGNAYEGIFWPPVIINGLLYYNTHQTGRSGWPPLPGFVCVDLRTGEELWRNEEDIIHFGQIYSYDSPNQHGAIPYLWSTNRTVWKAYNPYSGELVYTIENAPQSIDGSRDSLPSRMVWGPSGEMLIYEVDTDANTLTLWNNTAIPDLLAGEGGSADWQWRPYGKTVDGDGGFTLNVSIPDNLEGGIEHILEDRILGSSGLGGVGRQYLGTNDYTLWAISIEPGREGTLLWKKDYTGDGKATLDLDPASLEDGVFTMWSDQTRQHWGYSIETGEMIWGPTQAQTAWDMTVGTINQIGYSTLISVGYGGICYGYNLTTGNLEWSYKVECPYYLESKWGSNYLVDEIRIADEKVYLFSAEHSPDDPKERGSPLVCLDIHTGEELWSIPFYGSSWSDNPAIADGIIVYINNYDNEVYAFGKGQTKTEVTAAPKVIPYEDSVLIEGTVMDQSPGAMNTPAIADEDMSEWMQYVYNQFPMPTDAKGVEVTLDTIDPNGNFIHIGTVTSDSAGLFKKLWTPDIPGEYTIIATFEGSGAYWSSYAETAVGVKAAVSIPPPEATPAAMTDTYLTGSTIAILAGIAIAVFLILRKK